MFLFKKSDNKSKKKTIPKDKIIKAIKGLDYVDLGEPFGESARRYLSYQIMKLIDNNEITGNVITPEGVYISMSNSEVKDVVKLIRAKGICELESIATENKWNPDTVKLIAKSRINLLYRKDNKVITRETAKDILFDKIMESSEPDIYDIADDIQLKRTLVKELLDELIADGKIEGLYIKSSHKFLPMEMLEESIKELIENMEAKKVKEITFNAIAEDYSISDDQVYEILLKLYNVGDIDVQLNLGQKICLIKANIEEQTFIERIPEEEKKLEIEDLTKK